MRPRRLDVGGDGAQLAAQIARDASAPSSCPRRSAMLPRVSASARHPEHPERKRRGARGGPRRASDARRRAPGCGRRAPRAAGRPGPGARRARPRAHRASASGPPSSCCAHASRRATSVLSSVASFGHLRPFAPGSPSATLTNPASPSRSPSASASPSVSSNQALVHVRARALRRNPPAAPPHLLHEQRREVALEGVRGLGGVARPRAVVAQRGRVRSRGRAPARAGAPRRRRRLRRRGLHHITRISAWSIPDCAIDWRIWIMSRGVTPRTLSTSTTSCSVDRAVDDREARVLLLDQQARARELSRLDRLEKRPRLARLGRSRRSSRSGCPS